MDFTAVLCFCLFPALLDMDAKMPPAGRRTAHKRQKAGNVVGVQETGRPATVFPWRAVIKLSENKIIRGKFQIPGQKRQV